MSGLHEEGKHIGKWMGFREKGEGEGNGKGWERVDWEKWKRKKRIGNCSGKSGEGKQIGK